MSAHAHEARRSKRVYEIKPGSIVVDLASQAKRFPCLIVDRSADGFRLRLSCRLKRGQGVEVIPQDDPMHAIHCRVVWIGKSGSKQEGEVGLQAERVH